MKRVIITGPTGAIGTALCDILTQEDVEVFAICRPNSKNILNLKRHKNLKVIECDIADLLTLTDKLDKGFDAFYHLAWSGTIGESRNNADAQLNNIKYTLDATLLAKNLDCKVFIGAGSQAEYGHFKTPANGDTPCKPFTMYGAAKLSAGQMSRVYASNLGINHIWTRIFSVYGPGDDDKTLISYVINELKNKRAPQVTKSEQTWDYLYSYDAARALTLLAEHGQNGKVYCLGSGEQRSLKGYILEIKEVMNASEIPDFGSKPYSENQVMFLSADIEDLRRDTGFVPSYSFERGIKEILNFRGEQ